MFVQLIIVFTFFHYVMIFLTYLGLAFIATFFNVCVVCLSHNIIGGNR